MTSIFLNFSNFFLAVLILGTGLNAFAEKNSNTVKSCQAFYKLVEEDPSPIRLEEFEVPLDRKNKNSGKMNITYWVKKGTDPSKPPLLLIHGGPGGNMSRYYATFKDSPYTGDIVSIDNRNEGASHELSYDQKPKKYRVFRAREIVKDLEELRVHLYGKEKKWRVFGQSRGGAIAQYYLEMFPESLESVQTHGWAMMKKANMEKYTYTRSHFNVRAGDRFAVEFPEAAKIIEQAKKYFEENKVTLSMNLGMKDLPISQQPTITGGIITDGLSYKLSNYARWKEISAALVGLKKPNGELDLEKTTALFQAEVNGNIYVQYFNYILGTNGIDVGSPAPRNFSAIRNDPILMNALISEGRFVANAVYPAYLKMGFPAVTGKVDPINFNKIKKFLRDYEIKTGTKFEFTLFSSLFDTVAGPEMYKDEQSIFGDFVKVYPLSKSGHEGWQTEPELMTFLLR